MAIIQGRVICKSNEFQFKIGSDDPTGFITIETEDCKLVHMAISGKLFSTFRSIEIANSYKFYDFNRAYFKESNSSMNTNSINADSTQWYSSQPDSSIEPYLNLKSSDILIIDLSYEDISTLYPDLLLPTTEVRFRYMTKEFHIRGTIIKCSLNAKIEVAMVSNKTLSIFVIGCSLSTDRYCNWKPGTILEFYHLLPIYLWGKFRGFVATIRTSVKVLRNQNADKFEKFPSQSKQLKTSIIYVIWKLIIVDKITTNFRKALSSCALKLLEIMERQVNYSELFIIDERKVHKEFIELFYLELHFIRGYNDPDFIDQLLPRVTLISWLKRHQKDSNHLHLKLSDNIINYEMSPLVQMTEISRIVLVSEFQLMQSCHYSQNFSITILILTNHANDKMSCLIQGFDSSFIKLLEALSNPNCHHVISFTNPILLSRKSIVNNEQELFLLCNFKDVELLSPPIKDIDIGIKRSNENVYSYTSSIGSSILLSHSIDNKNPKNKNIANLQSIRQLLHMKFEKECLLDGFLGCVLQSITIDSRTFPSKFPQCRVILQDVNYFDIIQVYCDYSFIKLFIPGLIISICGGILMRQESNKFIYVKLKSRNVTSIEIVGLSPLYHIKNILYFTSNSKILLGNLVRDKNINEIKNITPSIHLSILQEFRRYDRCIWTILGKIHAIKSISANLKCKYCSAKYEDLYGNLTLPSYCSKCTRLLEVYPSWQIKALVDDNTMFCLLILEDDVAKQFFNVICDSLYGQTCIESFLSKVELVLQRFGYLSYDTYRMSRNHSYYQGKGKEICINTSIPNEISRDVIDEDILIDYYSLDFMTSNEMKELQGQSFQNEFEEVMNLLNSCITSMKFSINYEFLIQLMHYKTDVDYNRQLSIQRKDIQVQDYEVNRDYSISSGIHSTCFIEPITLECHRMAKVDDLCYYQQLTC